MNKINIKQPQLISNNFIPLNYPRRSNIFIEHPKKKNLSSKFVLEQAVLLAKKPSLLNSTLHNDPNLIFTDSVIQHVIRILQGACLKKILEKYAKKVLTKVGLPLFILKRKQGRPRKGASVNRIEYTKIKQHLIDCALIDLNHRRVHEFLDAYFKKGRKDRKILAMIDEIIEDRMKYLLKALRPFNINFDLSDPNEKLLLGYLALSTNKKIATFILRELHGISERTLIRRLKQQ